MANANLGSKRQCPKCAAKFYDFGAVSPITCPKCGKTWKEEAAKPAKAPKIKKETPKPAPKRKPVDDELDGVALPDMPGDDEGGIEELEPMEEEEVELTSLEEVEEHEEEEEADPNSDDAEDEMFTEMGGDKLVDDLEDHMEKEEDEDEDDEDREDDDDEDDDAPKKRR